jgi:hypothetical protein
MNNLPLFASLLASTLIAARSDLFKFPVLAGSCFGFATTAFVFLACVRYQTNFSYSSALAVSSAQAASNVMTMYAVLALLGLLARHGFMKLLLCAALIRAWTASILNLDLEEVKVDVEAIATIGLDLADHGAGVAGGGFAVALAVWLRAVAAL